MSNHWPPLTDWHVNAWSCIPCRTSRRYDLMLSSHYTGKIYVLTQNVIRFSVNTYPICDSSLYRSARRSFAPRWNHRSYVWTKALPGMVFTPAKKLSDSIVWTPIRYVTLQFRDRRGAASPCYRNRAEITVLYVCEQKPYPIWFSCWCKSYPVEHWLWDMLACEQALHFFWAKRDARERASGRQRLSRLSRAAQAWLLASFSNQESLPAGWGHVRELSQILLVHLFNEPYCKKRKSCSFGEPARRSQTK